MMLALMLLCTNIPQAFAAELEGDEPTATAAVESAPKSEAPEK